jgi:hypothetical protein
VTLLHTVCVRLSVSLVDHEQILSSESMETYNRLLLEGKKVLLEFLLYFILQLHHLTIRVNASVSQEDRGEEVVERIIGGVQLLAELT